MITHRRSTGTAHSPVTKYPKSAPLFLSLWSPFSQQTTSTVPGESVDSFSFPVPNLQAYLYWLLPCFLPSCSSRGITILLSKARPPHLAGLPLCFLAPPDTLVSSTPPCLFDLSISKASLSALKFFPSKNHKQTISSHCFLFCVPFCWQNS